MIRFKKAALLAIFAFFSLMISKSYADAGVPDSSTNQDEKSVESSSVAEDTTSAAPLAQYPQAEIAPLTASASELHGVSGIDFPKVKTSEDEALAKKFVWWPTDAKPAPFKDPNRSGYWWWPDQPGEQRPWGNQGFIYVRKIIFDYKSSEGEMKPSLIIKRILKNVKVYFDYDKSDLREDAVEALGKALYTLEHNDKTDILITGNADVRGSEKYNQKLGEKRAANVKQFILDKGIPEDRIKILSRGKMDALAPVNDIVGMQKDRNAQFMIAEVEEVMLPASQAALYGDKVIEEKEEIEAEVKVSVKEYTIQAGDSLWKIAKNEYGDGMQWKRLYEFNKDVISNPDRPKKGTKIKIPVE